MLAAAGVLGVVAASTRRRTHEIGIRMALGATSGRVLRQIVAEQLYGVAAGLATGALMSLWAVRALRSLLYEVQPFDLRLWALAATVVVLVAILGAFAPALAASRVQPVIALRADWCLESTHGALSLDDVGLKRLVNAAMSNGARDALDVESEEA